MFHVYKIPLARSRRLPEAIDICLSQGSRLEIVPGKATGEILCPPLVPRLAYKWVGFNVQGRNGDELGVQVALKRYGGQYQNWDGTQWIDSESPVYFTSAEIRERIGAWTGSDLQFRLKLIRSPQGVSPEVSGVRVGCQLIGNIIDYAFNTMLPIALSSDYPFRRIVRTSGNQIPVPPGLQTERMLNGMFMTVPDGRSYPVQISPQGITVPTLPIGDYTGHFLFSYKPICKAVPKGLIEQLTESPAIIIRPNEYRNVMEVVAEEWVRTGDNESALSRTICQVDLQLDVMVVGTEMEDVRTIAKTINQRYRDDGGLYLPAYDIFVSVKDDGYIQESASDSSIIKGSLNTASFKLLLLKVPETQEGIGRSGILLAIPHPNFP